MLGCKLGFYNIVMISAIYQHKSALAIHVSPLKPPSHLLPHPLPSRLAGSSGFWLPVSYSKYPLAIYFIYGNVYVLMLSSQIIPSSLSPTVSKACSLCLHVPCRPVDRFHQYHLYYPPVKNKIKFKKDFRYIYISALGLLFSGNILFDAIKYRDLNDYLKDKEYSFLCQRESLK